MQLADNVFTTWLQHGKQKAMEFPPMAFQTQK
jgi:hypothetical protein